MAQEPSLLAEKLLTDDTAKGGGVSFLQGRSPWWVAHVPRETLIRLSGLFKKKKQTQKAMKLEGGVGECRIQEELEAKRRKQDQNVMCI